MEQYECALHGVVDEDLLEDLRQRFKFICHGIESDYRTHIALASSLSVITANPTHLRLTKVAPRKNSNANQKVKKELRWKMEYLGNPPPQRAIETSQLKTLDPQLLESVLIRPILPCYVNPSPFLILPSLGFKVHSEFVRQGYMYTNESLTCTLTRLYSITEERNSDSTVLYDHSFHVEITKLVPKGTNLRETNEEIVAFAQLLHPFVTFSKVNLREIYSKSNNQ